MADKFFTGSDRRWNRKWESLKYKDFDDLFTNLDHNVLVSSSRTLFNNHGLVKAVIEDKSSYVTGNAWRARSKSDNLEWAKTANDYVAKWMKVADITGLDFLTFLYLCSVHVDRDGDAFVLLTETDNGYPQVQLVPAHLVYDQEQGRVTKGKYKGLRIVKGVILNKNNRPVAFRVNNQGKDKYVDISTENMIQLIDKSYYDQVRGTPLISHAINDMKDMKTSNEYELTAQMMLATIGFIERNERGEPSREDLLRNQNGDVDYNPPLNPASAIFDEGMTKFYKSSDPNSGLEVIDSNRPSPAYQAFHDRLERICIAGCGWSRTLLDDSTSNGTYNRLILKKCEKSVADRQNLLMPIVQRIVTWVVSKAIKSGTLPPDNKFYEWTLTLPPFLSIDVFRDTKSQIEAYRMGFITMNDILVAEGKTVEDHYREKVQEEILLDKINEDECKAAGVEKIEMKRLKLLGQAELQSDLVNTNNNPTP